jgi:crotonobetainyl-CoA:carnitine CoA-transferase CaiB-like acyl-CoA transferase
MRAPLEGLKVIDMSRLFPGPFCSMFLADLGAEVLRVESSRFRAEGTGMPTVMRNKRHMTLNLDKPSARDVLFRLLEDADVFLEGFRPGVLRRLEIHYEALRGRFPSLIYCSITGYGQDGPYRNLVGHDINYLGFGGVLRLNTRGGEPPLIPPIQIADQAAGGLIAAVAILAALYDRERTGTGRFIDISMTDGIVSLLPFPFTVHQTTGKDPRPSDELLTGRYACYQVYETRDGRYISIGALEHRFWKNLCEALDCPQYVEDQYAEGPRREEILDFFRRTFREKTRDEWFELLKERDVCIGKVLEFHEVLQDLHLRKRGLFIEPQAGETGHSMLANPIKMSDFTPTIRRPPAQWGEHTEEILREAGYSKEDIEALRSEGVI